MLSSGALATPEELSYLQDTPSVCHRIWGCASMRSVMVYKKAKMSLTGQSPREAVNHPLGKAALLLHV